LPHSPRTSGSSPGLFHSPGLIVTSSHHSSLSPLDMWLIITGTSSWNTAMTCSGR
jgi:hypothetical protein